MKTYHAAACPNCGSFDVTDELPLYDEHSLLIERSCSGCEQVWMVVYLITREQCFAEVVTEKDENKGDRA